METMIALQRDVATARQAARQRNVFFQLSHEMLAIIGEDGYIKRVNPTFEKATGFTEQELLSRPFTEFIHPDDLEATNTEFEWLREGLATEDFENRWRCKDGDYRWLSWATYPVTEEGLLYAAAHDVTAYKRVEEELRRSNEELEHFAYIASHDLQEPLRMVASYVQLLARRYQGRLDSDADDFIHYAVDGTQRMQKLIEDFLTYSRTGKRGNGFAPVDCGAALEQALGNLEYARQHEHASITSDTLPVVSADYFQIVQLFQNILGNSLKFHGEQPPCIHISVQKEPFEYIFCVRDNGIGISPAYFERIFILFQRLHTRAEYPGTGIGLALCKKIIECHQGRIWIKSIPGEGTALYFSLPIPRPVSHQAQENTENPERATHL